MSLPANDGALPTPPQPTAPRSGPRSRPGARAGQAASLLPRLVVAIGAFVALTDAFAFGQASLAGVQALLPFDTPAADPLIAALSALGLAALTVGLFRGKRLAWWLAILVFAAGVPVQLLGLGHTAGGVVAGIALALLTLDRKRYGVRSARTWSWTAWGLLAAGGAIAALETVLLVLRDPADALPAQLPAELPDLAGLAGALSRWLAFGDLSGPPSGPRTTLILVLAIASRLAVALALLAMLRPIGDEAPPAGLPARVRELGRRYGRGALLPFQVAGDKRWYSPPGREGFVAYGRDGRMAVAVGDPVGSELDRWPVFASFVDACRRHDWVPVVYQASEESLERLRALGFQASPIGREAVVDLTTFSLSGARRANLRHTITRAKRGGLTVAWYPDGLGADTARLGPGLAQVDAAWHAESGPPEMGFTISRFSLDELQRVPVALALDARGAPTAFVSFRSTGADGGFVLDLIRRVPGGVPGAVEFCLAEAAARFRDAGATTLSLGLAPLSGLDPAGQRVEERALAAIARLVRPFYDVEGLAFFKDKFAPRWEPRYVAVPSRVHLLGLLLALARLHLGSLHRAAARAAAGVARAPAGRVARAGLRRRAPACASARW
jgi:phosphatidylglycerol lysyltransferase